VSDFTISAQDLRVSKSTQNHQLSEIKTTPLFFLNQHNKTLNINPMKDCSKCKHRIELNPSYKNLNFSQTPCASCELSEPPRNSVIEYGDQFEHPSENTWEIIDVEKIASKPPEEAGLLMEYLGSSLKARAEQRLSPPNHIVSAFCGHFHPWQEADIIDIVFNWYKSGAENGRNRERSRVAQHQAMKKLEAIIESMGEPVRFELGGEW
jgi:hypothetical protein